MARPKSDQTKMYTTTEGNIKYESRKTAQDKYDEKFERLTLRAPVGTRAKVVAYLAEHPEYKTMNEFFNTILDIALNEK